MKNQKDNNYNFILKNLQHKLKPLKSKFSVSLKNIQKLSSEDKYQWVEMMMLKCKSLNSSSTRSQLCEAVLLLIIVCNQNKCQYQRKEIEAILKQIFYHQKGDKIENSELVSIFKDANFDTTQYETLVYDDPWYVKMGRWFSFD